MKETMIWNNNVVNVHSIEQKIGTEYKDYSDHILSLNFCNSNIFMFCIECLAFVKQWMSNN